MGVSWQGQGQKRLGLFPSWCEMQPTGLCFTGVGAQLQAGSDSAPQFPLFCSWTHAQTDSRQEHQQRREMHGHSAIQSHFEAVTNFR